MLVAIHDCESMLSGGALNKILRAIIPDDEGWYCCFGSVIGADIPMELYSDGKKFPLSHFKNLSESVTQFDWGDFYLFPDQKAAVKFEYAARSYPELIPRSAYLVRAVDGGYVYVFSEDTKLEHLKSTGVIWESVGLTDIHTFVYPD